MNPIGIAGIGVVGPGMAGWHDAEAVLTRIAEFDARAEVPSSMPSSLPPNIRRRVSSLTRLVLQCCDDTLSQANGEYPALSSVFASSCGDLVTVDKILRALSLPDRPVSPTQFHNSVHNSPGAYWSIARGDKTGSISVSAFDASFAAGLLNVAGLIHAGAGPTLLVAYDGVAPPPLASVRPILAPFAVGLLLVDGPARWAISVNLRESGACSTMDDPGLEAMRLGNPAARSLPLLERMAAHQAGELTLPYLPDLSVVVDLVADAGA